MGDMNTGLLFTVILVLAGVASLQFYRGRKLNLMLMEYYIKAVRKVTKPEDENYTWLGGYIGFRAEYKVNRDNIRKFEFTLTLLPRHSLLYFPISLATSRHDKLYIVIRPLNKIRHEAHLVQKGYYRLGLDIDNIDFLNREQVEIDGKRYDGLYKRKRDVEELKALVESLSRPRNVKHVAMTPDTNVFYVQMKPDPETIEGDVSKIVRFVNERLSKGPG